MSRTSLLVASLLLAAATVADAQAVGNRVKVNGMQMYYEVSGAGDPLVVLHGAYMNIPSMGAIIPKLAKTHKVYALELQGHGRTADIDRPITYQNLADDVAAFTAMIPSMTPEMFANTPLPAEYRKLAVDPNGFNELARKLIQLEKEPMAWEADVRKLKTPVLLISGDADVATLEHTVSFFRLLGGGEAGDMGKPLSASRLAVLPATSHTSVITQPDLLLAFIEPFLEGETPKGMF